MIALVDAGLGSSRALQHALLATGTDEPVQVTREPGQLRDAARIIVPGQGAFGDGATALGPEGALGQAIAESIRAGKPYMGICLGMQLLFQSSEESPGRPGLGIFGGRVRKLPAGTRDEDGRRLKVPHIGWAQVALRGSHPVLDVAEGGGWYYFVHSYQARPEPEELIAAVAAFGAQPLTAAVARDNVVGVQFLPEKSQAGGAALLKRFVEWRC